MVELKDEESTTLMSDETRKQGDVYEIFAVRDQTGKNWVLGLKKWLTSHHSHILQSICCPNLVVEEVSISLIINFNVSKHDCDDLLTISSTLVPSFFLSDLLLQIFHTHHLAFSS
jgi:hypothetical protein